MDAKPIYEITKFTSVDYPKHLAAILWFAGCPLACQFCYNPQIVTGHGKISIQDTLDFLTSRSSNLDAVVLSGGEATSYAQLIPLVEQIKALGYKVKLDTSGVNPSMLQRLIASNLVDFVALDLKGHSTIYKAITGKDTYKTFEASLRILTSSTVPFEVRTTIHSDLISIQDINTMSELLFSLGYTGTYYLQQYQHTETLGSMTDTHIKHTASSFTSPIPITMRDI